MNSIPYYGFDYLMASPLGFIYEDRIFANIKPKISYLSRPNLKTEDPDTTVVGNPIPFDSVNEVDGFLDKNQGYIHYEEYSLDSETLWKNRYQLQRLDADANKTATQLRYFPPTSPVFPIEMTKYDTPDLETLNPVSSRKPLGPFKKSNTETQEKTLEVLLSALFRPDVYLNYLNNSLVPDENANTDFEESASRLAQAHRQFRKKYFSNPVYKALVNYDMHSFFNGQIKSSNLTAEDELDLFKRRIILEKYLWSVDCARPLLGTDKKSYAERVYNQQFKGSLNLVRQFNWTKLNPTFSLSNDDDITKKVLKFDQPKYKEFVDESEMFLHEELRLPSDVPRWSWTDAEYQEEQYLDLDLKAGNLDLNNTSPLYIGWDGLLRKFLIKTATLPVELEAGDMAARNNHDLPTYFSFQAWTPMIDQPLTKNETDALKFASVDLSPEELSQVQQALSFEVKQRTVNSPGNVKKLVKDSLQDKEIKKFLVKIPSYDWRWKKEDLEFKFEKYLDLGNALPPKLDGIAWPGINNPSLIPKLKQLTES
jgi:hypothetical protein